MGRQKKSPNSFSYPVFRIGWLFPVERTLVYEKAEEISSNIMEDPSCFARAIERSIDDGDVATNSNERVERRLEEGRILSLPSHIITFDNYKSHLRPSVTVCMGRNFSKIWTRITLLEREGKKAESLELSDVVEFYQRHDSIGYKALRAIADAYLTYVEGAGVPLPDSIRETSNLFTFRLRAFNSSSLSTRDMMHSLQQGSLTLSEALSNSEYRPELLGYFTLAFEQTVNPREIAEALKEKRVEVFGYKANRCNALFTARTEKTCADFCGYGYDTNHKPIHEMLSHVTTRELLREYAQEF